MTFTLLEGDCLEQLKELEDNSIDSIVTDPPYGLSFMGKKWDYDVPSVEVWTECLRVLKPGGHLLSFSSARTYHRMTCAVEDAGFEIRDQIMWVYGSGFPKNYNVGKNMDKFLKTGNASWNGTGDSSNGGLGYTKSQAEHGYRPDDYTGRHQNKEEITEPLAKQWEGWGTALKPAHEPIVLARKPFKQSVVKNVLEYGTGAINIDGCRVGEGTGEIKTVHYPDIRGDNYNQGKDSYSNRGTVEREVVDKGRHPANFIHDGIEEDWSRYFYCAKAGKKEKDAGCEDLPVKRPDTRTSTGMGTFEEKGVQPGKNYHPTVKPVKLMTYLCRLITPPGGVVLDPFMGSGSTGVAAVKEGFKFIGIEREPDYLEIAKHRINNETNSRSWT